jgi:nucleotide-binding universal stress UspA family protein
MYTILCPTDFSTGARRAAEFAADLAKAWNAPLVLVHAYEVPQSENLAAARLLEEVKALTEESLLREAKRLEGHGVQIRTEALYGNLVSVVKDLVKDDPWHTFVVMGTRGASGFAQELFGTNASALMHYLPCPVWVVPEGAPKGLPRRIALAVDGLLEPATDGAFANAVVLGKRLGARVDAVHIHSDGEKPHVDWPEKEQRIRAHGLPVEVRRAPEVEEGLLRFLAETQSDALAFIARKHHWLLEMGHRSVSNALVFRAHQPLLILHEDRLA